MPYLPSELWLQILSHTSLPQHKDLWRSLRRTNRQLRDCVEQHFTDKILPTIRLELTFGLPCYDARNPLRGKAIFAFSPFQSDATGVPKDAASERILCALVDVEPEHYMEQLLVRWDRLRESSSGYLPESLEWRMFLSGDEEGASLRLKEPFAFAEKEKKVEGSAVGFEWRATLSSLFL